MLRINAAYNNIQQGKSITRSAMDSGYESLSGFNDSYRNVFGESPTTEKDTRVLNIQRITTPLGPMFACADARGLCLLEFTDRRMLEREFIDLQKRLTAVILPGRNAVLDQTERQLAEYFEGTRQSFSIPLQTPGTEFQNLVWRMLREIPFGETRSYGQQAKAIGRPTAVRAVANANGQNRIAIVIPCHRVIGADGHLTGYAGGLMRKKILLELESREQGLQELFGEK